VVSEITLIYCCGCGKDVTARLTNGKEVYPHRKDLHKLPFWFCDVCGNFVGCHYKTKDNTLPLGCIPTAEIKNYRKNIHSVIDPLWKTKTISRKEVYSFLSKKIGYQYHTAEIRSIAEARKVLGFCKELETNSSNLIRNNSVSHK